MRQSAADADVGDDVYGEDPTVNELEARAADAVGMEAALYVPSGTMGNQIAARVHTERGQEVLVEQESHVYKYELGGFAQHSQLQVRTYAGGANGCPTPEQVREGYVEEELHRPGTGLLCLENTHNVKGASRSRATNSRPPPTPQATSVSRCTSTAHGCSTRPPRSTSTPRTSSRPLTP